MIGEVDELKNSLENFNFFLEKTYFALSESKFDHLQYIFENNEKDHENQLEFHKIILLWTEFNTLFALDSRNGEILWKLHMSLFP